MAFAFDTLGFSKRRQESGVPRPQAEAHAEAARQFIMAELVTRSDLQTAVSQLEGKLDTQTLRLTVRFGGLLAAGIALLATILKLS